jgi:hypothetical protein
MLRHWQRNSGYNSYRSVCADYHPAAWVFLNFWEAAVEQSGVWEPIRVLGKPAGAALRLPCPWPGQKRTCSNQKSMFVRQAHLGLLCGIKRRYAAWRSRHILSLVKDSNDEHPPLTLISGSPGMGKSTSLLLLAYWLAPLVKVTGGCIVLYLSCHALCHDARRPLLLVLRAKRSRSKPTHWRGHVDALKTWPYTEWRYMECGPLEAVEHYYYDRDALDRCGVAPSQ